MLKTILISSLAAIIVIAIGFSAYNVMAGSQPQAAQQQAQAAQGSGYGAGGQNAGQGATAQVEATAQPAAQAEVAARAADVAASAAAPAGAEGTGGGQRRGQGGGNAQGGTGVQQPQNGMSGLMTYSGVVSAYAAPEFTLLTADGQAILMQLGNQGYAESLGLALQDGEAVTVTGFIDSSGALAVTSITVQSTGQTYTFRDSASGRPTWAGGRNK